MKVPLLKLCIARIGLMLVVPVPGGFAFELNAIPDVRAAEGQRVELVGTWTGDAAGATFRWLKDGGSVPGQTSSTLVLPGFAYFESGDYQLVAVLPNETVVSPPARVSVDYQVALTVRKFGQTPVPAIPGGVIRIAGGGDGGGAAVKADGTVVAWGFVTPPAASDGPVADVAFDGSVALWLMADGTVGTSYMDFPGSDNAFSRVPDLTDAVALGSNGYVLRRNGTVVRCRREYGPATNTMTFPRGTLASRSLGLQGVVELSSDQYIEPHALALLRDGSIITTGPNDTGQNTLPPDLTDILAVSSFSSGSAALSADGRLAVWGNNWLTPAVPPGEAVVALSRSGPAAITSGGKLVAWDPEGPIYGDTVARFLTWNQNLRKAIEPVLAADSGGMLVMSALDPGGLPLITNLPERLAGKGDPFHFRILAKNRPVSYAATGLPPGLQLNTATGVISGTPAARGSFPVMLSATTAAGATASKPLRITVLDKKITVQPQGRVFRQPENYTLSVSVAGEGPFSYQWQKNGVDVPGATGSSLAFSPAQESDDGKYACLVTDPDGTLPSAEVELNFIRITSAWGLDISRSKPPAELQALRSVSCNGAMIGGLRPDGTAVWWQPHADQPLTIFDTAGVALTDFKIGSWFAGQSATGQIIEGRDLWNGNGIPGVIAADWNAQDGTYFFTVGFDGRVRGKNMDSDGYGYPQPPWNLKRVTRIAVGREEPVALLTNGAVVNWDQPNDPLYTSVADVAAGFWHFVVLMRDGTVRCFGNNDNGQCRVPPGLANVVQVAAGGRHSLALKSDGTVVGWGYVGSGESIVPPGITGVCAIAASGSASAVLLAADPIPGPARVLVQRHLVAAVGDPFFLQLAAQNQPSAWSVTGLPAGFSFDAQKRQITGTPTGMGDAEFQITVANALGGETVPVTLHILDDAFKLWANAAGIPVDRQADPDNDGLSNLAEYAFGLNPARPDPNWFAVHQQPPGGVTGSVPMLSLHFRRVASRSAELHYSLEISDNLQDWQTLSISAAGEPFYIDWPYPFGMEWNPPLPVETPDPLDPDLIHVELSFPLPGSRSKLFFRMRVIDR